ncbi:hypothetical protein IHQ72_24580 [Mesorhizobium onobrychidis]|uniref:Uncharacterized protein n=1 Tax=Mesorhizobium onobrychidis TaxID=2775404 RepID=A0ABY5QSE0_9HYPH|nr:hypothetical protein IHQ72_24580 [Mesorhizobium onobrychidis]
MLYNLVAFVDAAVIGECPDAYVEGVFARVASSSHATGNTLQASEARECSRWSTATSSRCESIAETEPVERQIHAPSQSHTAAGSVCSGANFDRAASLPEAPRRRLAVS